MAKVRKTVTLDEEVVEQFENDPEALSATLNRLLSAEAERRQRMTALGRMVSDYEAAHGPLDQQKVDYYRELLS
jgi:hypothetical protein